MNKFAKILVLSLAASGICGCGAGPASKYYQLTVPTDAISRGNAEPLPVTLLIGPINAPHLYLEDRVVYSTNGVEMGTYQYQRWAEPPTEMIREVLLRELRASGRFAGVSLLKSNVG